MYDINLSVMMYVEQSMSLVLNGGLFGYKFLIWQSFAVSSLKFLFCYYLCYCWWESDASVTVVSLLILVDNLFVGLCETWVSPDIAEFDLFLFIYHTG
jgi:hypothetical protein